MVSSFNIIGLLIAFAADAVPVLWKKRWWVFLFHYRLFIFRYYNWISFALWNGNRDYFVIKLLLRWTLIRLNCVLILVFSRKVIFSST
jgi:hypothetical protein